MKMFNALVLTVALTLMLTLTANADLITPNLIINGSFETPDIPQGVSIGPVGGWAVFYEPILGWTPATAYGLEIQDRVIAGTDIGEAWLAYDGNQFAELDVSANSGMFQSVNTISGKQYNLSFAYSPRPAAGSDTNIIDFYFNGALIESITGSGIGATNTSWSLHSYTFTATGTSSEIRFMANGVSDGLGGFLDDVQFSAAHVPDDDDDQAEDDQGHPVPEASTFRDNFNGGNAGGWIFVSGDVRSTDPASCWSVENGELIEDCIWDAQMALVGNLSVPSHSIETQVDILAWAGIILWYKDLNNYVRIGKYQCNNCAIYVTEWFNGIIYYAEYPYNGDQSVLFDFKVDANSETGELKFYVGGKYVFTHTVQTNLRYGLPGLVGGNGGGTFDNFAVTSIKLHPVPNPQR